jgi:hypothetical protein
VEIRTLSHVSRFFVGPDERVNRPPWCHRKASGGMILPPTGGTGTEGRGGGG